MDENQRDQSSDETTGSIAVEDGARDDLDVDLARTVLRQGELRLQAQLQLALAADQRAMMFAAIFTPLATAVLGLSLREEGPLAVGGITCGLFLIFGALLALISAKPIRFQVVGNKPDNWWSDEVEKRTLARCLRNESNNYQRRIETNSDRLTKNARLLEAGALSGVLAPLVGLIATVITMVLAN